MKQNIPLEDEGQAELVWVGRAAGGPSTVPPGSSSVANGPCLAPDACVSRS